MNLITNSTFLNKFLDLVTCSWTFLSVQKKYGGGRILWWRKSHSVGGHSTVVVPWDVRPLHTPRETPGSVPSVLVWWFRTRPSSCCLYRKENKKIFKKKKHCLHVFQVSPFLTFDCLFPVIHSRSNNRVNVCLDDLCFWKVRLNQKKRAVTVMSTSSVTTIGDGVPLTYGSTVKAYFVSLRNLPITVEGFDKSDTCGSVYFGLTDNTIILKDLWRLM